MNRLTFSLLLLIVGAGAARAELEVPALFSDHLILQRARNVPIWGKAMSASMITVKFGDGAWTATTKKDGTWRVDLPPMEASAKGRRLSVHSSLDREKLTFQNVVVGEVWICSGQSNMAWPVRSALHAEAEIEAANHPGIRLFTVGRQTAEKPMGSCKGAWTSCSPESIPTFSAVAYFFGRELHQNLEVPIGLINSSWGGSPAEAWTSRPALESEPTLQPLVQFWDDLVKTHYPKTVDDRFQAQMKRWDLAAEADEKKGHPPPRKPRRITNPARNHHRPANLYNGMVAPLVPFAFRGVIWYQGESNQSRAFQYRTLFPAMIQDWREAWSTGPFPFYFVQIANYLEREADPGPSSWAEIREAQLLTMKHTPNAGMAVTIDIGDAGNIHPRNKQDVGKRLAQWALAKNYGRDVVPSGPVFQESTFAEGKATLVFELYGSGLKAVGDEGLKGFTLAGVDRKFVRASAVIQNDRVVVSSPEVAEPVAARYGWADNPDGTLFNKAGLPASPFRTDAWPGVTDERETPF